MDDIITTEQLTKKYKNFTSVNHVSLHIRKGSIYGFLGPNGARHPVNCPFCAFRR